MCHCEDLQDHVRARNPLHCLGDVPLQWSRCADTQIGEIRIGEELQYFIKLIAAKHNRPIV